ncbi:MAG TPA: ATP-binding protein [Candidatus Gracilibacteria bacterium]|nr:ATP-binding protein [Candidatus Gracilibacteria bacterium]
MSVAINKLKGIVVDQNNNFQGKSLGVIREIEFEKYLHTDKIVILTGMRRTGKSTLLRQFAQHFENYHFLNFDDERLLNFDLSDFENLILIFKQLNESKILFFDEIQNIPHWENFVRRLHDEDYKVFITGSNAKLLSSELSTHLTGRYQKIEIYPFSFREVLKYFDFNCQKFDQSTVQKSFILQKFDWYFQNGGLPEMIKYQDFEIILKTYEDIIYRDIISRFAIRDIKTLKQVSFYLFNNIATEFSYQNIKNILNIASTTTVKNFVSYLEDAYLIFELFKYDYSLKKQFINNKKCFGIDHGLQKKLSISPSLNLGRILENIVFLELKRRGKTVFFHRNKYECDFVTWENNQIKELFQVCYDFNAQNRTREIAGLVEAMETYQIEQGVILSFDQEEIIEQANRKILVVPVWQWLIEDKLTMGLEEKNNI